MPSLIDFRRRIRAVKHTQQITKAMKMVSAAKLRRAQEAVLAARPFANMLGQMLGNVARAAAGSDAVKELPLLQQRESVKKAVMVVISADRGLAGAFNSNVNRGAQKFMQEQAGVTFEIESIGKKGRDYFRRRAFSISGDHQNFSRKPVYADVAAVAAKVSQRYAAGEVDAVYVAYNEFKSVMTQRLQVEQVLPVPLAESADTTEYIYEQPAEVLLASLLPRYVEVELWRSVLESTASEHAARMTAMDAASRNASEVIERVTLQMNRVRQASITREIIEVVSGASALK
ncbi:MAG: ATP synthase F1 subunit gamma [Acidobacteriota bacterium]